MKGKYNRTELHRLIHTDIISISCWSFYMGLLEAGEQVSRQKAAKMYIERFPTLIDNQDEFSLRRAIQRCGKMFMELQKTK